MNHKLAAVGTLIGTVVGAGIFGIPYVVAQAGFLVGAAHIVVLGLMVYFLYSFMAEIALQTPGKHQLTGYAAQYLGKRGKRAFTLSMIGGIYGAMLAYTIQEGHFFYDLLWPHFGGSPFFYSLLFYALMAYFLFHGISWIERIEEWVAGVLVLLVVVLAVVALPNIDPSHLTRISPSPLDLLLPYGVVLFAFLGIAAIPEMYRELEDKQFLKKAVLFGTISPLVLYLIFAAAVVGVTGPATSEAAVEGLGEALGPMVAVVGRLFGILAMGSTFLVLSQALKEMYWYDYQIPQYVSWGLALIVPFLMFVLGSGTFIGVLAFVGAILGGLEGIMVVMMHRRINSTHWKKIVGNILIVVLSLGIVYGIVTAL